MLYYAKITSFKSGSSVLQLFCDHGILPDDVVLDTTYNSKSSDGLYASLKTELSASPDGLTIDSVSSLGKNSREISKELQWFLEHNIPLFILDMPSTFAGVVPALEVLAELYMNMAEVEIQKVKSNQQVGINRAREHNQSLGRKRIPYPDNWLSTYTSWKKKEITFAEFMALTGLKKSTLYNLIKQYQTQESSVTADHA